MEVTLAITLLSFIVLGSVSVIYYSDLKETKAEKEQAFTAPETATYKVSGIVTTQNAEYVKECGVYIVPKGAEPVFIDKGPEGKVYYKPKTNQIIYGDDLVLLGDL